MIRLYRCIEDGEQSTVYRLRHRRVAWWGRCGLGPSFPIEWKVAEARRITCHPDQKYTRRRSGWYRAGPETYAQLGFVEGIRLWSKQLYQELRARFSTETNILTRN